MNTPRMPTPALTLRDSGHKSFQPANRFGPVGLGVMVGAHLLIGYLLVSGLGRQAFEIVKRPLEATIVQEVKLPPPPPPPPPKIEKIPETPKVEAPPPPAYVPPPEVVPPPAPAPEPAITAVQTSKPVPPPPPAPPPTPAPTPAGPIRQDMTVACPRQVAPVMPERALDEGIGGKVRAEVRIRGGRVVDVQILSGPKIFHSAVRAALQQYQCLTSGGSEIVATQEFEFKVE